MEMGKSLEEIAREAAEKYWDTPVKNTTGSFVSDWKDSLEDIIADAIEQAFQRVPVPGPVSEERLAEVRRNNEETLRYRKEKGTESWQEEADRTDLLAHIDHLTRVLHDCGQDGTAEVWSAGYRAGMEEMARLVQESQMMPHPSEEASNE
jgi:hypothetical protein